MVATSAMVGADEPHNTCSPFHVGEQRIQTITGAREVSERLGRSWHSNCLSPAAVKFFAQQSLLYTASRNADGRLWASALVGLPGFLSSPDKTRLVVEPFSQFKGDPAELNVGDLVGTLGISLTTRQRQRLNGVLEAKGTDTLTIKVEQSFSGCPKYIQGRTVEVIEEEVHQLGTVGIVRQGDFDLGDAQKEMISRADTLFLATCYFGDLENGEGSRGVDVSHRGGPPGFVQVVDSRTLQFADYVGNYTFTTLGNLAMDPTAAIQFIDFSNGDSLQLSGTCKILWEERELPGAQRTMEFCIEAWVHVQNALPLRSPGPVRWSPYNPLPTWQYSPVVGEERIKQLYNNYIAEDTSHAVLRCLSTKYEADDITTFEFELPKGLVTTSRGNELCDPGQFASFDFQDVTPGVTVNRTWTISSTQQQVVADGSFTITVKRVGLASRWLFENMKPGRTICLRGIDGDFTLARFEPARCSRVLLVAGGVGITPFRSMFHECKAKAIPVTLLYSVKRLRNAAFLDDLSKVAQEGQGAEVFVTVTQPPSATLDNGHGSGEGYQNGGVLYLEGHVTRAMLQRVCPQLSNATVFICGPPGMMKAISTELATLEFPMQNLHQELFNF